MMRWIYFLFLLINLLVAVFLLTNHVGLAERLTIINFFLIWVVVIFKLIYDKK